MSINNITTTTITDLSCGDNHFGPIVYSTCRNTSFDFTLLFSQTILSIIPSSLFILLSLYRAYQLVPQSIKVTKSPIHPAKLLVITIYSCLQLAILVLWSQYSHSIFLPPPAVQSITSQETVWTKSSISTNIAITSATVSFLSSIVLCVLSDMEHKRSIQPSDLLNVYLLFSSAFDSVQARTLWLRSSRSTSTAQGPPSTLILGDISEILMENVLRQNLRNIAILMVCSICLKLVVLGLEVVEKRGILLEGYRGSPPEMTSGVLNRRVFLWLVPLFRRGFKRVISFEDLFPVDESLGSEYLQGKLLEKFDGSKDKHALLFCVLKTFKRQLLSAVLPRLALIAFTFAQPFLINRVIRFVDEPTTPLTKSIGYGLIGATSLIFLGISISKSHYKQKVYRMITMFRGALAGVIYEKTLGLPIDVRNDSAAITLMSTDVDSIATAFETVHDIWANTIEVSLAVYLLEAQLGIACVVPVALAVASTLCSLRLSKFMGPTRRIWNAAVQKRVGVTSSALGNMKGLKLMGMTDIVSSDIQNLRSKELDLSKDYRKLVVWINCISNFPHMISPFLTFLVFTAVSGNRKPLTAANAFTSLAIIGLLTEPLSILLGCIPLFFSSLSSFDRIQEYITQDQRRQNLDTSSNLQEAELQSQFETVQMSTFRERRGLPISTDPLVTMERAHFGTKADDQAILRDITLQIRPAKFTMIIGPVASGKSTLLKSILGELKPLQGELSPPSVPIAYCDQEPWLINDTLRKNITGPDIFDDTWYNTVIHACVLEHDFHQLPQGDMTRIGSKGVSLSGGQRNRVALARALYAKNELVVLDSVTAGLDNNSEEVVFSRVLGSEGILRKSGTTTVFATHAVHRAKHADWIIMLGAGGTIVDQGNYKDLSTRHTILQNTAQITKISDQTETKALKNETPDGKSQVKEVSTTQQDIEDLSRRTGDLAVYKYYFNSVGYPLSISFLTVSCASTFFMFFPQVWLQWWSDYDSKHPGQKKGLYLGVYGILSFTNLVLFGASIWYMFVLVTPRSAKRLHWILLQTVMKAPYTLMVKIDTGIILNRFSQDMSLIDIKLPQAAILTVYGLLNCIAATIIIATTAKWISIIIPPGCVIVWFIQKFYLRTSRQLRFLDLESKSPLYTHFSETLGGLASIRAYGWTRSFSQRNLEVLDASQRPYYLLFCLQSWLNLVMDIFVAVVAIVLVACAVGMKSTSGGMIGLALVSVLMFNQHLAELIHAWTNLETSLGAIARVKNFATTTVVEDFGLNKSVPPDNWPMEGRVCIENVASSYGSDATSVLQDINIELKGGQKIGICGRSGSGKSSLILTLYRLLETTSGSIHIDGLNLTTLSREAIRSKLIAIPQETFIRPGTIRCNIDPQSLSSTEAIITALTKTGLWTPVSSNGGLESDMDALSLSPGQRQLFCLATAILRKGKVLVLDEATSSVDGETEEVMQRLIEEEFRDSTVITVAHRLETIMTCDLIAVMDRGRIVEYGTPRELLQRKDIFWNLYNSQH